jgi:DNA-binding response OmpR family regulator
VLFLESKGYSVETATNGADGLEALRDRRPDLVLLDEQMPGLSGLDVLAEIQRHAPEVPVVMITKSEEERIMEEALGGQIADYLTKPVNPSQVLLTAKRLLDRQRLEGESAQRAYLQSFPQLSSRLNEASTPQDWTDLYMELVQFDARLDAEEGVRQVLEDQMREANKEFSRYVERRYAGWIEAEGPGDDRPLLSHEVLDRHVVPLLRQPSAKPVVFFVIDCMRLDQWFEMERLLHAHFDIERDTYFGILPTATPYARNAIFSGLLPRELHRRYPKLWSDDDDEHSKNRHEETFLGDFLERRHLKRVRMRYDKLVSSRDGREFAASAADLVQHDLSAVVVNFVDILAHTRSDSPVLREIAPDERAYRALTRTWFEHSWLLSAFQTLARQDCTVVVTTDHGAIRCLHATKVVGDRDTSTALRYKHGRQLKAEEKDAIFVKDPEQFGLPRLGMNENYILAKEDFYFVYPTNYHHYLNLYRDSLQHGGVSLEEMVLPVATLRPKR